MAGGGTQGAGWGHSCPDICSIPGRRGRGDPGAPLAAGQLCTHEALSFLQVGQQGPAVGARAGSSRCKAPIEAPLIFQGFSGFGLYKTRQEEERGERDSRQEESLCPAALCSSNNSVKTEK